MRIITDYKTVRISKEAYRKLQDLANKEQTTLKEGIDILLSVRNELQIKVSDMSQEIDALKWDRDYIVKQMKKTKTFTFPDMDSEVPQRSAFPTKYLY